MPNNLTNITPHLEVEITPGKNLLYCGTFQVVWNQLADEMNKAPVTLKGNPPIVDALNKRQFEKSDINEACYLAMIGTGHEGIVDKITQALKEKFNAEPGVPLNPLADLISYSYLEKNLPFDLVFDVFDEPLLFNNSGAVQSFGIIKSVEANSQVEVFDYIDPDDFIVKLGTSPLVDEDIEMGMPATGPRITDDIILAKVTPNATLEETVNAVFGRVEKTEKEFAEKAAKNNSRSWRKIRQYAFGLKLHSSEKLQIPKIDFNVLSHIKELEGKVISSGKLTGSQIDSAVQSIKFKLDEAGAVLKSEAAIEMTYGVPDEHRHFIFDRPFLFCLREKGAQHPYLVLWIDNAELLVKA